MTFRATVLLIFFALLFAFIGLNWPEFSAPATLSLGFTVVEMPVGFVMLGALLSLLVLFSAYVLYLQASWAMQQRRFVHDLEAQRKLADQAEASRSAEVMARVNAVCDELKQYMQGTTETLREEMAQSSEHTQGTLNEISHTFSAHLGEMEDKLDQVIGPRHRS